MEDIDCNLEKNKRKSVCIKKLFPIVMFSPKTKTLSVVYEKRVADFKISNTWVLGTEGTTKDGWEEVQVLKDNGWRRIRDSENMVWED